MSLHRGIIGFETGRNDAGYALIGNPVLDTVTKRTGLYALKDKKTVASIAGCANIQTGATIASAALFRMAFRVFFQPITYPSANNYVLAEFTSLSARLETNTVGALRLNSSLEAPGAYSAYHTIIGHWYEAQLLVFGYEKATTVAISGRTRFTIDVYDWGLDGEGDGSDPILVAQFATSSQTSTNIANINCVGGFFSVPCDAGQEMKGKVLGYNIGVSASTPNPCSQSGDGEYNIFPTQTTATRADNPCTVTCGPATNGAAIEQGSLNGYNIQLFKKNNTAIGAAPIELNVGQTAVSGVSCTREYNFDDVWWEIADGVDVPFSFYGNFPSSTHVQPFPITAQGFYNLFTPAGHFADINAIPMVDTNTITASLVDKATSYLHAPINDFEIAEHIRVYGRVNGTALSQSLIVFEDPSILTSMAVTIPAVTGGVIGDTNLEGEDAIIGLDFNLMEYGAIVDNAGNFNIHALFMEVLTGEADIVLEGPTNGGAQIEGGLGLGDLGISQGNQILITDGSGIYSLTPGQFFDRLYARNAGEATVDVEIPEPFFDTFFAGG